MSSLYRILLVSIICLHVFPLAAQIPSNDQPLSNIRQKKLKVGADTVQIDTLSIIPNSFSIPHVPATDYQLDLVKAVLFWKKKPGTDSITLTYRVFPFQLNSITQRMQYDSIKNNFYVTPFEFDSGLTNAQRSIFDFGTLKAEGSFGRQVGFGNSQDAVLNSTFNLQLSGMLGDSIEIQAAITDNNIPIQPDGNTQQLNEFDQVYLQFKKRGWQLNLGDIDLRQDQSYFLNFYKRLQGIAFQTSNRISRTINSKTLLSGSVAKGKFTRNVLLPLEGNQGPYRLRGANNEFFFIVLANTERVFYDGQLLQRGEDQDYVINYNTAEITFTPKRMITKDSRIQVEFEYADRNYLNANLYVSQELEFNQRLKLRLSAFQNSDAKNSQINQVLDDKQKQFLSALGDSIQRAFYPSAVIDSFAAGKILYEKQYAGLDSFYVYSTNPLLARYNLSFSDLGAGNGDYVLDFNGANGKVYRYIAPVGAARQGQYEPVQILVAPKKQQVVDVGLDYKIGSSTLVKTEIATSSNDVNTFSSKEDGDDRGWAGKVQLSNDHLFSSARKLQLITSLDYEYVQRKFRPLERLRNVEFSRDWGLLLQPVPVPVDENIVKATAQLRDNKDHQFYYQFTHYQRSDDYRGFQNAIRHFARWKGWQLNNQFIITQFDAASNKGTFVRPVIDISKELSRLKKWRLGLNYALEKNNNRYKINDSLLATAFWFDVYSAYLQSDETKRNRYKITFFTRSDKYPLNKNFIRGDRSLNLNFQTELLSNPNRQFYLNTTFRKLKVYDTTVSKQKAEETVLGRAEYVMNEWKGLVTGNILYEVGAGQEQRRDFAYLEVPAGTGQYAWIDYNSDGVQQLNEFEIAAFPDQAKFLRIFTPTNDFIKANYTTFNYSFTISPRSLLNNPDSKGFKKILSRLMLLSSLQTSKKSLAQGHFEFNPFKYDVNDAALITLNTTVLNTIAFNRFSSKWGIDLSNLRNNGKSLLTYGYESRKLNEWTMKFRWNINNHFALTLNGKKGLNALYTPQFANRNYELSVYSVEPFLVYIRGTRFRLVTSYKLDQKKNLPLYGGEKSVSNSINIESKYNILQSGSITAKFTVSNISYGFPANTTVSYIMLDGLLPGKNFLWMLGFSKRLLNNLELNFQYDGRKSGQSRTVHLGRAGITALF
ncbi:MAG TPA: hypothetical protein VMZ03_07250 [Chitinophagaceae bacterium]|nr:hypothetical protein [Chitinophagaceae bacterium]